MSGSEEDGDQKEDTEPQDVQTNSVPSTYKTRGKISDADATGVFGYNTAGSGTGIGVAGNVDSGHDAAVGIRGEAANASGNADGVVGITNGTGYFDNFTGLTYPATGVTGRATNSSAAVSYGVRGLNSSNADFDSGVLGSAFGGSGEVFGVRGETNSGSAGAAGVYGDANDSSGQVFGVRGHTASGWTGAAGVFGNATTTGQVYGVKGSVVSDSGSAVHADGRLTATDTIAGDPANKTDHVAFIENDVSGTSGNAQILMLSMPLQGTSPGSANNFITFRAGKDEIGAIEGNNGGVTLNTTSADLGEYFPLSDPTLEPDEGTVLGLSAGELAPETDGADAALVVTRSPAVLGNNPNAGKNEEPSDMVSVALIGQVPVKIAESVEAGDRLVAAGDGTACVGEPGDDAHTVGRALESVDVADGEIGTVRTFVGGPMSETPVSAGEVDPQDVVEAEYEETIAELRRENDRLGEENEELRSRLEELEGTVEKLVTNASATSGPEPADD